MGRPPILYLRFGSGEVLLVPNNDVVIALVAVDGIGLNKLLDPPVIAGCVANIFR